MATQNPNQKKGISNGSIDVRKALKAIEKQHQVIAATSRQIKTSTNKVIHPNKKKENDESVSGENEKQIQDLKDKYSKLINSLSKQVHNLEEKTKDQEDNINSLKQLIKKQNATLDVYRNQLSREQKKNNVNPESKTRKDTVKVPPSLSEVIENPIENVDLVIEKKISSVIAVMSNKQNEVLNDLLQNRYLPLENRLTGIAETLCENLFQMDSILDDPLILECLKKTEEPPNPYASISGWSRKQKQQLQTKTIDYIFGKPSERYLIAENIIQEDELI